MSTLIPYLFAALALIHILPALAVLAPSRLAKVYGYEPGNPVSSSLMKTQALLFGMMAVILIWAILTPELRLNALLGTVFGRVGWLIYGRLRVQLSQSLRHNIIADLIGLLIAAVAAFLLIKG